MAVASIEVSRRRHPGQISDPPGFARPEAAQLDGARAGLCRGVAEKTFSQIEGFGSYGFPRSHAASFALIAHASAWLESHHPDVFCCAFRWW
jgi:hypothetical protein